MEHAVRADPGRCGAATGRMSGPSSPVPAEIRKLLYTTNAIESLHMQLRKIIKTRGHFPTDEAATKLLYLALRNILTKWKAASRGGAAPCPRRPLRRALTTEH